MFTIYGMIDDWHLMNTLLGLGIVYIATVIAFTIWTLRGFVAGVPADLEEAAMIDGCTEVAGVLAGHLPAARTRPRRHRHLRVHPVRGTSSPMALLLMKGYNLTLPPWLNAFQSHRSRDADQLGRGHGRLHPHRDAR